MRLVVALMSLSLIFACGPPAVGTPATAGSPEREYVWERLLEKAPFPASYNYPAHTMPDGASVLLHPQGTWSSRDGSNWTRERLPPSGMNSAYMNYLFHEGASWALGRHSGNYERFQIDPLILRTSGRDSWETVGRASNFPRVIFSAAVSFGGALWILGGFDGDAYSAAVWRSEDGLDWKRVTEVAPWSPRAAAKAIVFRNRMFLIGGGVIDGPNANDVWSSADGIEWRQDTAAISPDEPVGFSPVVYDDKIWLVGANRSGRFRSEMLVSSEGRSWRAVEAPWSPRGGVAVWVAGDSLFLTGGKYSYERNGETTFVYSNDVWRMRRS